MENEADVNHQLVYQMQLRFECLQMCDLIDSIITMQQGDTVGSQPDWKLAERSAKLTRRAIARDSQLSLNETEWEARLARIRLIKSEMSWFVEQKRKLDNEEWIAVTKISDPIKSNPVPRFAWSDRLSYLTKPTDNADGEQNCERKGAPTPQYHRPRPLKFPASPAHFTSIEQCLAWILVPVSLDIPILRAPRSKSAMPDVRGTSFDFTSGGEQRTVFQPQATSIPRPKSSR